MGCFLYILSIMANLKKRTVKNPSLNSKTLLVCGGAGFIGSNFIRMVLDRYPRVRVINLDKLTYAGNPDNLRDIAHDSRYYFVRGDIAKQGKMMEICKEFRPDYIVNFAAETHVDRSVHEGATPFFQTNVLGTLKILEAVRAFPVSSFLQISTDEVYGSLSIKSRKRFTEESPLAANSPYAASKASADLLCRSFFKTYNVPVVITRCSNNYGPYQTPEKLIPFFVSQLMVGKPLTLYGDGRNVRDWIHVDDHNNAALRVLLSGVHGEIYNVGASTEISNIALVKKMLRHFKKSTNNIIFIANRPGHDLRYAVDASKIEKQLGWKPKHSFESAFLETIDWYKAHQQWMRRALKRIGTPNAHISH